VHDGCWFGRPADERAGYVKGQARSGRDGAGLGRDADGSQAVGDRALSGTSSGQTGPPEHRSFRCVPVPCRFRRAPPVPALEPGGRTAVSLAAGAGWRMCHRAQAAGDLRHRPWRRALRRWVRACSSSRSPASRRCPAPPSVRRPAAPWALGDGWRPRGGVPLPGRARRLLVEPCRGLVGLLGGPVGRLRRVASHRSDLLHRQLPGPTTPPPPRRSPMGRSGGSRVTTPVLPAWFRAPGRLHQALW
jgi:hypothetical protein